MERNRAQVIPLPDRRQSLNNIASRAELAQVIPIERALLKREQSVRPEENAGIGAWINYFDNNWRKEGLPRNWERLQDNGKQVGFSMDGQMNLLKSDDPESRRIWASQTRRDIEGFILEYLSPHIVYPWRYEKTKGKDGIMQLVDPRYGWKRMIDTVSGNERNGSVKKVVEALEHAVVEEKVPEGSVFIQVSPQDKTPTGLFQDNGKPVIYDDTHLIFSQVENGVLSGITVKTDFTKSECRELVKRLTGKIIEPDAPIEEYIESVAFINPESLGRPISIDEVVSVAAGVRSDLTLGSDKAFKNKTWDSVIEQIHMGDSLYNFNDKTRAVLRQFEEDVIADKPSREDLPKYIATTILRIAQIAGGEVEQASVPHGDVVTYTYGDTLKKTVAIPGCAGGGSKTVLSGMFGISRAANLGPGGAGGGSCPEISCGGCSWKANESEASRVQAGSMKNCPKCGWSPKAA